MNLNKSIAIITLRLILGITFAMRGYWKIFNWGLDNVYNNFFYKTYKDLISSDILIYITAFYTSYAELIAGLFLVIGFKRNYALYILASVLIIVTFGHALAEPVWDMSHIIFHTILLATLLFLPEEWDIFSVDYFLKRKKIK